MRAYRPFGEIAHQAVLDPGAPEEARGFIGERYDADAGLQFLNARYYDPELGLFLQPDWFEVTEAGVGTNRYAYSFNDPVNLRDPGGNEVLPGYGDCDVLVVACTPGGKGYGYERAAPRLGEGVGGAGLAIIIADSIFGGSDEEGMSQAPDLGQDAIGLPIADEAGPSVVSTPAALSETTIFSTPIASQQWQDLITNAVAPGTYVLHGDNGMIYVGKGDEARMSTSIRRIESENPGVRIIGEAWEPANTHRDAFKREDDLIQHYGGELGVRSPKLWNRINSPGRRYNEQDNN